jgi:hypothetical protein
MMDKTGTGRLVYTKTEMIPVDGNQGSEERGELRTYYIDLGIITRIEETFSKSTSTTPRTSMSAENAFVLETGSSVTLNISFERRNPTEINDNVLNYTLANKGDADDIYANETEGSGEYIESISKEDMESLLYISRINSSKRWSNNKWYREMTAAVDRWQTKTDGFEFMYIPDQNGDYMDNPYIPAYNYINGYVKSLRRTYKAGDPTVLYCTMEFHVGTIHLNTSKETETQFKFSHLASPATPYVEMSVEDELASTKMILHSVNKSEVSSEESYLDSDSDFTLTGGPNQPFECLEFSVSKYHLQRAGSDESRAISEGMLVKLKAFKDQYGQYEVIKSKTDGTTEIRYEPPKKKELESKTYVIRSASQTSGIRTHRKYKVQAYCRESALTSDITSVEISDMDVWTVMMGIMRGNFSQKGLYVDGIPEGYIKQNVISDINAEFGIKISVKVGVNLWYLLKLCANLMHAKVFFADGHMYVVDYSLVENTSIGSLEAKAPLEDVGDVLLDSNQYRSRMNGMASDRTTAYSNYVCNYTTLGLTTAQISDKLINDRESVGRWDSVAVHGIFDPDVELDNNVILDEKGYEAYRRYKLDYFGYPQTPVQFTLKELYTSGGENGHWRVTFPPASFARHVRDTITGFDNTCQPRVNPVIRQTEDKSSVSVEYVESTTVRPPTLMLSSYKRDMWSCCTEYTFGEIEETSLSKALNK